MRNKTLAGLFDMCLGFMIIVMAILIGIMYFTEELFWVKNLGYAFLSRPEFIVMFLGLLAIVLIGILELIRGMEVFA